MLRVFQLGITKKQSMLIVIMLSVVAIGSRGRIVAVALNNFLRGLLKPVFEIKSVLIRFDIYLFVNKAKGDGSPKSFIHTL